MRHCALRFAVEIARIGQPRVADRDTTAVPLLPFSSLLWNNEYHVLFLPRGFRRHGISRHISISETVAKRDPGT